MTGLVQGARDLGRGARFLAAHRRLWGLVVAPALVTLVLVVGLIWGVVGLADPFVAWVASGLPGWLAGWVGGVVRLLVVVALAVGGFLVFVSLAGVIAGPFCELLSEAIEARVTGAPPVGFSLGALGRGLALGLGHAARRLAVYLAALALLFVLGALVPVFGTALAALAGAYLAATSVAYDCYDAVFGRRLWSFDQKRAFLRRHRGRTLGLGAVVAALMLIPLVNLLALGVGAAAATLAVLDLERTAS